MEDILFAVAPSDDGFNPEDDEDTDDLSSDSDDEDEDDNYNAEE